MAHRNAANTGHTGFVGHERELLQKTHTMLTALKAQEESGATTPSPTDESALVNWRRSITKHAVTCRECGESFKQLSVRHLQMHDLDGSSYRTKYNIPRTQSLAVRKTTARRREVVQATRPWEKTPTFRKGHESAKEEERPVETTEAARQAAKALPQPKQQRKSTPRKTTRKKSG